MRKTLLLIITLATLMALVPAQVARAQDNLTFQARAGFDGFFKLNGWVPVYVVVENNGSDIDGEIRVKMQGAWNSSVFCTQPAVLPTHSRKQFTLYVSIQNYTRELTVQLVQKNKVIVEQKVNIEPLDEQQYLIGVLSSDSTALNYLAGLPPMGKGRIHVAHLSLTDLPAQGRALGGLDTLIVHNLDTALLTPAQRDALRGWVAFGGQLIITGGPSALSAAAGLDDLLPVRIVGSQTTADLDALGVWAGASLDSQQPAVVAQVEPLQSELLAGPAELPLLVRRSLDRGRIDYLALDPDLEPLRTWLGNDKLWPKLLFATPLGLRAGSANLFPGPFVDPLSNIPSLDVPPVLLVTAFLFTYILIVGPLNLLVLKLIDKQSLAWITVPTLIVLFSCTAYVFGIVSRGRKVVISEISVVRAQPASQMAAIDSSIGIYSPLRRHYDVQLPDYRLVTPLTAQSYGSAINITPAELRIEQGPPTWVRNLDINVGAMQGFAARGLERWDGIEANLVLSEPSIGVYHIEGTITNRSNVRIVNSVLVLNIIYHHLGDLAAGETRPISLDFSVLQKSSYSDITTQLAGPFGLGQAGRERERRLNIADSTLQPYYYGSGGRAVTLDGLTLLGWLSESPGQAHIQNANVEYAQTTLLIAPLPVSQNTNQIIIPQGFMAWQVSDGDPNATPKQLYSYQPTMTFKFYIPDSQGIDVEKLILYVDSAEGGTPGGGTPFGNPPVVYVKNVASDQWQSFNTLSWGANELPDPERFIDKDGGIEVRVSTNTIQAPVAIDFSVVGTQK